MPAHESADLGPRVRHLALNRPALEELQGMLCRDDWGPLAIMAATERWGWNGAWRTVVDSRWPPRTCPIDGGAAFVAARGGRTRRWGRWRAADCQSCSRWR